MQPVGNKILPDEDSSCLGQEVVLTGVYVSIHQFLRFSDHTRFYFISPSWRVAHLRNFVGVPASDFGPQTGYRDSFIFLTIPLSKIDST
jgi:hypothetical protein